MEVLQGNAQKPSEKLHTLLVEDTLLPRKIAENLLMEEGYEVVTAQTAQEALEQSNQKTFDLILMDVGLPDGNGIDVAKAIRENPKNPNAHTFIVALTAHSDPDIKTACLNVGMQAVVDKPLNLEKIKVVVARINQSEKGELPIIDLDSITQSMGGNIQLAKEMLDMLMKELPKFRQEITDAFVKQDWAALKHHVHKLHGGLCYSGAVRLKDATRDFEKQLIQKAGPFDEYYQTLIDEINKTLDEYNK
jgi:two-component system sensor histidine kinase BarA